MNIRQKLAEWLYCRAIRAELQCLEGIVYYPRGTLGYQISLLSGAYGEFWAALADAVDPDGEETEVCDDQARR